MIASTTSAGAALTQNLAVYKEGTGTWTLTGANTYTGGTTITGGTLDLGGSTATGSIGGGGLTMGNSTFNYTRTGSNTQNFTGTTFNSGQSYHQRSPRANTLNLGAITRNTGANGGIPRHHGHHQDLYR